MRTHNKTPQKQTNKINKIFKTKQKQTKTMQTANTHKKNKLANKII